MTAYELADWMECWTESKPYPQQNPLIIAMLRQQQAEIEALKAKLKSEFDYAENLLKAQDKCPPASWWKGDPTCGGITENYGLGKAQEK
jgi:hypothetical protein